MNSSLLRSHRTARCFRAAALAVAVGTAQAAFVPVALAQSQEELNRARQLFKQGIGLEAAGDWAKALAKFEEVAKVKATPEVQFHIGRCKENLGRLTEALGDYRIAEYEATQAKKDLPELTKARKQLEQRIPKVVITRGEGAEQARIELDGVQIGEAKIGKEIPVDPGSHKITATIRNRGKFDESFTVEERETKRISLVPPDDLPEAGAAKDPVDDSGTARDDAASVYDAGASKESGGSALPWVFGGVGAVGLIAAGVFWGQRNSAADDLDAVCRADDTCPESSRSSQDDGERAAMLTSVSLGVGVVGLGTMAVLLLTQGGDESSSARTTKAKPGVRVDVAASPQLTGVNVVGRF